MGRAFGLSGTPAEWATMSEHALHAALEAATRVVPPEPPPAPPMEAPPPPVAWQLPVAPAPPPVSWAPGSSPSMSVPTRSTPAWIYLAAVIGVIALGAVAFLALK